MSILIEMEMSESFRCEKPLNMSKNSTKNHSKTDWEALEKMTDEEIDFSDIPEITEEQFANAVMKVGGKTVERGKMRVNMYLDRDIVAFFKEKAGGRGYQTLINESLRKAMSNEELETTLRRIIREEIQAD